MWYNGKKKRPGCIRSPGIYLTTFYENGLRLNRVALSKKSDSAEYPSQTAYVLDQDYKWEDTGVEDRIVKAGKYYQAWCEEIENSLNHLQVYLDSEDYEQLYSSYVGWQQYMNGMFSVEQSIYYVGSKYMASSDLAGGSSTYPVVMEVKARRAREYAIQLMALEYTFSQDIQFVYK